jgi:hypothetical protein
MTGFRDLVPKKKYLKGSDSPKDEDRFRMQGYNRCVEDMTPLLDYVEKVEKENRRLSDCHNAELGVCKQHCEDVIELQAKVERLEKAMREIAKGGGDCNFQEIARKVLEGERDDH